MAAKLQLKVISPARTVLEETVGAVVIPGADGKFGLLPRHAPMISLVEPGIVKISGEVGGGPRFMSVAGGFCEVRDNHVVLVVDAAEMGSEVDLDRARSAMYRAKERLTRRTSDEVDVARAEMALKRSIARLKAGGA